MSGRNRWNLARELVRNIHKEGARVDLSIVVPPTVARPGTVRLLVSPELAELIERSKSKREGFQETEYGEERREARYFAMPLKGEKALLHGIELPPGQAYAVAVDVRQQTLGEGDIVIEQRTDG